MTLHKYRVINAAGQELKPVFIGSKSLDIASAHLQVRLGNLAHFLKLQYAGTETRERQIR